MRAYIRDTRVIAGEYMRVHLMPVRREAPKGRGRRGRYRVTSEAQRRYNAKCAAWCVCDYLHANFCDQDIALRLSYASAVTVEEAERHIVNFLRRVSYAFKRAELGALKYLYVTEEGVKGGRVHHHLVLSGGLDRDVLEKMWGLGYANSERLQFTEDGLAGLSRYIVKRPCTARSFKRSRNLVKPEALSSNTSVSPRQAQYINANPEDLEAASSLYPGWRAVKVEPSPVGEWGGELFTVVYYVRSDAELGKTPGRGGRKMRRARETTPPPQAVPLP